MADKEKEAKETTKGQEDKASKATKPAAKKAAGSAKPKAEAKSSRLPKGTKPAGGGSKRRPLHPGTFYPKQGEVSGWTLIDAKGLPLGRLSSHIAQLLMGKTKAAYSRHADTGDFVVVVNAKEVKLTGNKWADKMYHYHTNYPGGIKSFTAQDLLDKKPETLIRWAVYGMLPKGHMGRRWYRKLRVFAGPEHSHEAQQPKAAKLPNLGNWE